MTRTSELVAIGTRDIIPPQGLVTLELRSATTGRLRKRVQVENALMDWYKTAALRNGGRGSFARVAPTTNQWADGVNPLQWAQGNAQIPGPAEDGMLAMHYPERWPSMSGASRTVTNWLWATASAATPDPTLMQIPTVAGPEVTAGCKLDFPAYAAEGIQNKRGSINAGLSGRTSWNQIRMVVDFATSEGNGTYRSIGLGSLVNQTIAPGGLRAFPAAIRMDGSAGASTFMQGLGDMLTVVNPIKVVLGYDEDVWAINTSFQLIRNDLTQYGAPISGTTPGVATVTVSAANVPGSGGPNGPVIAPTATDFWVARNQILYRCVTPTTNVAMTVTNTYDLSGTLGAEAILDMCYDGTNLYLLTLTRVYVVNPATGASTSNWAHSLTGGTAGFQSIMWDPAEQVLWINFVDRTTGGVAQWGQAGGTSIPVNQDSLICYGFTLAGSLTKWNMGRPAANSSTATPGRQLNQISVDGRFLGRCGAYQGLSHQSDLYGPSMATHALLGSDVVKTSNDVLRITYDLNFA